MNHIELSFNEILSTIADREDQLELLMVVGYIRIKKESLELLKTDSCDYSWVDEAVSVTGKSREMVLSTFENLAYKFKILKANNWKHP